ncbi:thylakoid membrane protein [Populus alba x Populus x berolinensis]|uniref:Thylakoid membrane protein n=1 Tax=Populus alba x Populus x berolinensis TaxID=444605 RepID=A0AAD6R1G1_9ROSI|nr:thylakoid membrane protein [Populus alba x Populus x berolinensis]
MTAIISSPAATATIRTAIFNYDVQFGRFSNNKNNNNKGCCFLSAHSFSPPKLSPKQPHRVKLVFLTKAADSSQASPSSTTTASKTIVTDDEFSLAKVSFGVIGLGFGISLLSYGFGAYFNILPGSEWSAIMLTYGFPLAIIGMALKYAELKPVPCLTYSNAEMSREKCATPILKQVRNDVIRYRYGDEQHLDEALKRIFQYGLSSQTEHLFQKAMWCVNFNIDQDTLAQGQFLGGGIPRRNAPILQMIREEVTEDGKYCLVLVFEAKALQLSDFEKRQGKFTSFFGPDITAEIGKGENNLYEVRLISNLNANASPS